MRNFLFEHIEPFNVDYLKVSDIHTIYYEESGNKDGIPVLVLHGGPGAGSSSIYRRFFDPEYYRIILFDQRGSGKSKPFAEIKENTTWDLVNDIEKLRKELEIKNLILFGGSWGSTLALSYAITFPTSVNALILRGVYLCRKVEMDWYYQGGASFFYPDRWEKFISIIPENERNNMIQAYHNRICNEPYDKAILYAKNWSQWEAATINLIPSEELINEFGEVKFAIAFAKIETHYFINKVFFNSDNFILDNVDKIENIKTKIVHGRYDIPCPLQNAWELNKRLKNSELIIVDNAGHSTYERGIQEALIRATEELKIN